MSDEEKDVDVDSGVDEDGEDGAGNRTFASVEEKKAHHNALERKRRDHIKESFCGLRDSIPSLAGEKSSRAQILHKATEHIQYMRQKNDANQSDIDELKRYNMMLDEQVRQLEKTRATGALPLDAAASNLLSSDLLLNNNPNNNNNNNNTMVSTGNTSIIDVVGCDGSLHNLEPVMLDRPNNTGDHDDYTIAPKRIKTDPS